MKAKFAVGDFREIDFPFPELIYGIAGGSICKQGKVCSPIIDAFPVLFLFAVGSAVHRVMEVVAVFAWRVEIFKAFRLIRAKSNVHLTGEKTGEV